MKNIVAVFIKQVKDTFRNKTVFMMFLIFPALTVVMENCVKIDGMPEHFFVKLFSVMFIGMAPLTTVSSIISEEKEKNTLRALIMANVRPAEYLLGIGAYIFMCCMACTAVFAAAGGLSGNELVRFVLVMAAGIIISEVAGAVIGISCNNQMSATAVQVPVMMILSFLPMLAMFSEKIEKIASIFYSQQISRMINGENFASGSAITAVNLLLLVIAFTVVFRKKGIE